MAIKETRWQPDTCGCEIIYSWSTEIPENQRKHDVATVVKRCQAHVSHNDQQVFDTVVDENKRKNIAFDEVKKVIPTLTPEFFTYEFDETRALKIILNGPSPSEKAQIHAALNSKLGVGKTEVK